MVGAAVNAAALAALGTFDSVLDVGGNVGDFAALAREVWPDARVTSFEPVGPLARANRERAGGRWWVEEVAVSRAAGEATISVCLNQPSASTMHPGLGRQHRFGIVDTFEPVTVETQPLDEYLGAVDGRLLVKVDVEGHELEVIAGAQAVLRLARCVIVECNQARDVFEGAPPPDAVDAELRHHGLYFAGIIGCLLAGPGGEVVQFDGVWRR
jgi:FkbM family methyltransferase